MFGKIAKFWVGSGAKECRSCRLMKILKNAPTLAIRNVDIAENEPFRVWQKKKIRFPKFCDEERRAEVVQVRLRARYASECWQMFANFGRLVLGCIDVSDSESRRIFQHFHQSTRSDKICILLHRSKFKILANCRDFSKIFAKFLKNRRNSAKVGKFCWNVGFAAVQKNADLIRSCRFWKILKNAPTLAIRGVDAAENEPSKIAKMKKEKIISNYY